MWFSRLKKISLKWMKLSNSSKAARMDWSEKRSIYYTNTTKTLWWKTTLQVTTATKEWKPLKSRNLKATNTSPETPSAYQAILSTKTPTRENLPLGLRNKSDWVTTRLSNPPKLSTQSMVQFYFMWTDFSIIKLLGKGAYSEVYLVRNKITGDLSAMKVVEVENINTDTL